MNPSNCFVAVRPGTANAVAGPLKEVAPAKAAPTPQKAAQRQFPGAPAVLAASVAGVRASQRRGKHRGTALKQAAATKELVVEEQEGQICSLWPGGAEKTTSAATIPDRMLESDIAGLLDNAETLKKDVVRSCRKGAKQVATIGPASSSEDMLEKLFLCGVDVFRLNFSHGEHAEKLDLIAKIRNIEDKYRHPIAILADMQGPKQRCGKFADPDGVELKLGQRFRFDMDPALGDDTRVQLPHPEILQALEPGKDQRLLLDDGKIRMNVVRKGYLVEGQEVDQTAGESHENATPFVECEVTVPGRLGARKGVNTPDVILPMSPITPKDREDLLFCCKHSIDWIAMSFVQKHEDMEELKAIVSSHYRDDIKLLAKIEKPSAVDDLQKILEVCDGVMVARGDLGVEMNPQDVPFVQKEIIREARLQGKPVIVATQMLESMITNPMPTRAECSDIANAIIDGCDAVMLSGESAVGKYPVEAVTMQRRVIESAEKRVHLDHTGPELAKGPHLAGRATEAVLGSAATLAKDMKACAIVVFTASGNSARLLAQRRPTVPIVAVCKCLEVARQVSLIHGIYATSDPEVQQLASAAEQENSYHKVRFSKGVEIGCRIAQNFGLASQEDDWVVVVARLPLFSQGCLNTTRLVPALGPKVVDGYGPSDDEDSDTD